MGTTGGDEDVEHPGQEHAVASGEPAGPLTVTATPVSAGERFPPLIDEPRSNGTRAATRVASRRDRSRIEPAIPALSRGKRVLDIGVTVAALPVVVLLGTVIALLVATTSRGSVLFLQERVGLGGRRFRMVKFRTMQPDAERRLREDPDLWSTYVDNDFKLPADSDPRLTRVGRLLRRWSLDELPQVINVLSGSMSWVGPRPVTPDQLEDWGSDSEVYLSLRPGITGWWQINGRSDVQSMDRIAYDRDYVDSWNLWLDVRIIARTPLKVFHGKGAF